ncbi:MAG: PAS domain-containing protein [Gloeocapsa sp. UFS-A4-WI-NPMV-4B04]|jgi:two-component system CheB/CheR fusion protein|nr:PAS domain-containing protein [Gloeocapsa sp. UFS-A4-WI-NPMV-4B04]
MNSRQSDAQPESTAKEEATEQQDKNQELFPIVGIGASAGGVEAFTQLLKHLPIDTGMGFVLIQHLSPDHKSLLSEILARTTQMPVMEVQDCMIVEPNHVYIIPPNSKMTLAKNLLRLTPRDKIQGQHKSVDAFFNSLAQERGSKAIGVVLSGADGDGALGLKAIKVAGGITFAQCEGTAQVSSMPNTAAATGHVDFILSPEGIAVKLAKISRHPYVTYLEPEKTIEELTSDKNLLKSIFTLLQTDTGIDFTHYKHTTLKRRILRRMALYKLDILEDYAKYLQSNPKEVEALSQEFLIHVTSFFRDSEVFKALTEQVFPSIMLHRAPNDPIRIWVAGCSTGEEVYSIAICLLEFLDTQETSPKIMIFGTDISELAIEKARSGTYIPSLVEQLSPERLRRFFVKVEGGYEINKLIRQMCVFAKQNILADPPFSSVDLISCRNVLIYFGTTLQKQVLPMFHYSLKPTGFLLLGTSESTGESSDLFTPVDKKLRIYARKLTATRLNTDYFTTNYLEQKVNSDQMNSDAGSGFDLLKEADRIVWNKYAPAGVIINSELEILQFRGDTSPYLSPAPGKPSFNLLNMAGANLRLELRTALMEAKRLDIPVRKPNVPLSGKELKEVTIEVISLKAPHTKECYFLVLFEEVPLSASPQLAEDNRKVKRVSGKQTATSQELIQLKCELATTLQELAATKEYLQSVIQEQESITQELTTANEEILSSNEELRSTNEELQTAQEEIQATNEELTTLNEELHSRILESNKINSDLRNLLSSVNIPIVMLGSDLSIRRFTPIAEKIFNLIPTDVGRPFNHIKSNINVPNLEQLIEEVIDTLVIKKQEVQDQDGHWYDLFIRPYKTLENKIDGAVVMLVDIDTLKSSSEQIKESRDYAEAIIETIPEPLIVLDNNLNVNTANRSFYNTFQVSQTQTESNSIFDLGNGQWNIPQLRSLLEKVLPQSNQLDNFEVEHIFEKIGRKTMLLNARKIRRADEQDHILLVIQDITERKLFEEQRDQLLAIEQSARSDAEVANRTKDEFLSIVSHELRNPLNSILGWIQLLRNREFAADKTDHALLMIERSARSQAKLIEDILDASRSKTGKLQVRVSAIALAPVIEAAIDIARPSAQTKNIQIEALLEPETIKVSGDPDRLQQVIWNLLSNAIKFTPAGGRVTVKLERTGSLASFQVSDTGQGISADFLPHVFERFRQANSSSTRSQGGLGLGLSIVYHLVELHGGTIRAESLGEGQGATFTVQLPLLKTTKRKKTNFTPSPHQPINPALLDGLRVLVVDDEPGLLELLKTILEQYAAHVTAVASAKEAIAHLTANPGEYDVLLSDIGMPDEDGYALIRQVRELSAELGGQIPAAALTAYVRGEDQSETFTAGFQRHIAKPVEPEQLVLIIAELAQIN